MTVVAIIPALRSSTVDLERHFAGRPLLAQTVSQARSCPEIYSVVVVTDDAVLARIAEEAGAEVLAAAGDGGVGADLAAACAAEALADDPRKTGGGADACVILDPGRPVRTPEMIAEALDHFAGSGSDALLSVHASDETLWREDAGGFARLAGDDARTAGSDPHATHWAENRALVVTHVVQLRERVGPLGGRVVLHPIPRACALELRSEDDWCAGEAVYRRLWAGRTLTQLATIRLLVFDFDGVMTDNRVVVFEDGREGVLCSRGDGMGMDLLRASGLPVAVISKEGNPVVSARCRKLKIPCIQGIGDKLPVLRKMVDEQGIDLQSVAYMGNDINDLECMEAVGLAIAPADAEASILRIAGLVTTARGGFGAVREVADLLVAARAG